MENRKLGKLAMSANNEDKSFLCDVVETEYEKVVLDSFRRRAFINYIGAEVLRLLPGFCTLQLKYRDELTHDPLCFHPGVIGTLAENAGEFAALTILPAGSSLETSEYKLNLLAPAQGDVLVVHGKIVKSSKTMTVCTSEIYVRKDRFQNLCGIALMTYIPG